MVRPEIETVAPESTMKTREAVSRCCRPVLPSIRSRRPRPSVMSGGPQRRCRGDESVEQVELVLGIVDEVDAAATGHYGESEEGTRAGRRDRRRR